MAAGHQSSVTFWKPPKSHCTFAQPWVRSSAPCLSKYFGGKIPQGTLPWEVFYGLLSLGGTYVFVLFCFSSFLLHFIFIFFLKHLYWSIIALQWYVSFCFITKWISYTYTYIPISLPSCISLPPSLSHPSRWSQSSMLISLSYAAASH